MRVTHFDVSGFMEIEDALIGLAALAQGTRLDAFRLLVREAPGGIPAGILADRLAVPQNTLSAHLAVLSRAGLVAGERDGRWIIYRADLDRLRLILLFLLEDCCQGRKEICAPLVAALTPCCPASETSA
jgi:ArsR family transcriptional regulator, arsenate/arsenite/antimonite-responsive transcriptional repressor